MPQIEQAVQPLVAGERLTRDEFIRRWEQLPNVKFAELIGGIVYMPSPLSIPHGEPNFLVDTWLGNYAIATPGCIGGTQTTWFMLEDVPQPDVYIRIIPECGGARVVDDYPVGVPELIVEISVSSKSYDLGPKLELYRAAGVPEYISYLVREKRIIWRRLVAGQYIESPPDADGIHRSTVLPGLWLDPQALLKDHGPRILEVLNLGLATKEHADFVRRLEERRAANT